VKSVVTIHDLIFLRYPEYYPFVDRTIYSLKFKHACKVADKIIATSEATKHDIISFFGTDHQKIEVVYQTCDPVFRKTVTSAVKYEIRKKYNLPEKFILYLGTIELRKNALSLIKAYLSHNIDIPLLIAGKPTGYMNEINEYLRQHPSGNSVLFRHAIESEDLPALYQSAEVFVYPSVFEGFGIPILEALCSGVPVITSTGSCFIETGGDAALYCDPLDISQIGNCLSNVLNNADTRKSMIEKGFKHSTLFEEANVADNMMNVYLNLQ
jgi:glycosyltransferase involved in cell wall biosynthesis